VDALVETDREQAIDDPRRWLERAVIGLNLCLFAKGSAESTEIHPLGAPARPDAGPSACGKLGP
jgi:hypothetical protein